MATTQKIKFVLTAAGTEYDANREYRLHDYIITDGATMYICHRVDATTMVCKGHPLTDEAWWHKAVDLSDVETQAETAVKSATDAAASAVSASALASQAANAATSATAKATAAATSADNATSAAKTATANADTATANAKQATEEVKTAAAKVEQIVADVEHLNETMGPYAERTGIALTPKETGVAISSDGVKVKKSGWAIAEFTAEKGNVYLFKPGATDGSVCVFAEEITSVETRGIDYTYTYNANGTIATATATYGGKTHAYTYSYDADGRATITEGTTVVAELPMTYTTTVGAFSPLVRLNADAELPTDGYCRYMSHFKGNSSIKVVVSYKVGSADLTMKVTRDGVLASISTQLGNLSQKEDETRSLLEERVPAMWMEVAFSEDTFISLGGVKTELKANTRYMFADVKAINLGAYLTAQIPLTMLTCHWNRPWDMSRLFVSDIYDGTGHQKTTLKNLWRLDLSGLRSVQRISFSQCPNLEELDMPNVSGMTNLESAFASCKSLKRINTCGWDTSKVTNMCFTFGYCPSLTTVDTSGWDTAKVTTMTQMFCGCSSLTTLDVSGWDTAKVTTMKQMFSGCTSLTSLDVSGWDTSNVRDMFWLFCKCPSLKALDVSGWDTSNVRDMNAMFSGCTSLTSLDVSGWDTSNVTVIQYIFEVCTSLTSLNLSGWNTGKFASFAGVLSRCTSLTHILFGPGWGTPTAALALDLSTCGSSKSYKLTDETWASMLTMYDRATAGLDPMTISLSKNHNVPDGWTEKMTALGYTITLK